MPPSHEERGCRNLCGTATHRTLYKRKTLLPSLHFQLCWVFKLPLAIRGAARQRWRIYL